MINQLSAEPIHGLTRSKKLFVRYLVWAWCLSGCLHRGADARRVLSSLDLRGLRSLAGIDDNYCYTRSNSRRILYIVGSESTVLQSPNRFPKYFWFSRLKLAVGRIRVRLCRVACAHRVTCADGSSKTIWTKPNKSGGRNYLNQSMPYPILIRKYSGPLEVSF